MTGVDGWIWASLVGLSVLVPVVAAAAAFRAAPAAGINPGRTALAVGSSLGTWLLVVLAAGGAGLFRASPDVAFPVIAVGVALPIIAGLVVLPRLSGFKKLTASIPQAWLLAAQTPRILGAIFLVLYAQDKLPAHFALTAGIGDLAVGLAAPAVAFWYAAGRPGRHGLAMAFNVVGLLDLVMAIGTGFLSAPSPLQVFATTPSTEVMTVLPMVLVPAFLLPTLLTVHVISIRRLLAARRGVAASGTRFAQRAFS
jgi:hypothetical protein